MITNVEETVIIRTDDTAEERSRQRAETASRLETSLDLSASVIALLSLIVEHNLTDQIKPLTDCQCSKTQYKPDQTSWSQDLIDAYSIYAFAFARYKENLQASEPPKAMAAQPPRFTEGNNPNKKPRHAGTDTTNKNNTVTTCQLEN
jgi:hypothetical protein